MPSSHATAFGPAADVAPRTPAASGRRGSRGPQRRPPRGRPRRPRCCLSLALALVLSLVCGGTPAFAQLTILSQGNQAGKWKETQLQAVEQQLASPQLDEDLKRELQAQRKWLTAWNVGKLSEQPLWQSDELPPARSEPALDPAELTADLRQRLLGPAAHPTSQDTKELQEMLADHPQDVGVRQLQLHWLDQTQYRKTYPDEIAEAALRLMPLIEGLEESEETKLAIAFCLYRRGRALVYRELDEVLEKKPLNDPEKHDAALLGTYRQLKAAVPEQRTEFVLLDIRMLRRDRWNGRALELLEDFGSQLNRQWFLKKRRDILRELGWQIPAREAEQIYAAAFPDAVAEEQP